MSQTPTIQPLKPTPGPLLGEQIRIRLDEIIGLLDPIANIALAKGSNDYLSFPFNSAACGGSVFTSSTTGNCPTSHR